MKFKEVNDFIKLDEGLIRVESIASVDFKDLERLYKIEVTTQNGKTLIATNLNAIECLMRIYPSALEGKRLKWAKRVWYVHNLIGHPLMQFFAMFKLYKIGMWIHEVTVPKPIGFKNKKEEE